jgi:hypothetical protein
MNQWKDKSLRELVDTFGYPDKIFQSPDGNEVYEYMSSKLYRTPESFHTHVHPYGSTATTYRMGGDFVSAKCRTWFELQDKKIVKVTFKGQLCRAPEIKNN